MKNRNVVSHKQRIDSVFAMAGKHGGDDELLNHLSRYLCVLVSGFIEVSVQVLVAEFLGPRATPAVARFAACRVDRFTNANSDKIVKLIQEFGEEHGSRFSLAILGEMKDAIDGVVNVRHAIAHGKSVGIGFVAMQNYYKNVVRAVEELERLLEQLK